MMDSTAIFVGVLSLLPFLVLLFRGKYIYFEIFALFAIVVHGIFFYGPNILYFLVLTYIVSTAAELTSLKTPIYCFGVKYRYNLNHPYFSSRVRLLGVYPLEISLGWVILKYLSFNLTMIMSSAFGLPIYVKIFLVPMVLVSLDFIFDPVDVHVRKLWKWEKGSAYFDIPLRNFLAWYLVGFVASVPLLWVGLRNPLTFHYLLILPIIFYAVLLDNIRLLLKLDLYKGILGALPAVCWVALSTVGLYILYLRQG